MTMTTITGCAGLTSVCDTPAGVRKGALIIAVTATKLFVLRKRISSYAALTALCDKYRREGKIQRSQWLECELATFAVTQRFVIKGLDTEIPGTGPAPRDMAKDEFTALTLGDDIRLGCAAMKGGYALMPQPVAPEAFDDDIDECEADARDEADKVRAAQDAAALDPACDEAPF